jgi:hypothetical protein
MPAVMDPLWLKYHCLGFNTCMIPEGKPHSRRFDENSPLFQCWIGSYHVIQLKAEPLKTGREVTTLFAKLASSDQSSWLKLYGSTNPVCKPLLDSKLVYHGKIGNHEQMIFQGDMLSGIDDNKAPGRTMTNMFAEVASVYNNRKVSPELFYPDSHFSPQKRVRLTGLVSFIRLTHTKSIFTYACLTHDNFPRLETELLKVMLKLVVVDLHAIPL